MNNSHALRCIKGQQITPSGRLMFAYRRPNSDKAKIPMIKKEGTTDEDMSQEIIL